MNVLTAAWVGAGSPPRPTTLAGTCAYCGATDGLIRVRSVVSGQFTGFDSWSNPCGAGVCPRCAWGYATPALRAGPHLVTRAPATLTCLERADVAGILATGPLSCDAALVVPLRPGRKHLMPGAAWGRVNVEDAQLAWGSVEVQHLHRITRLRALGFGSRMLTNPAPPFPVLRTLPAPVFGEVLDTWAQLEPWRQPDNPWMSVALHVTTPPARTAPDDQGFAP